MSDHFLHGFMAELDKEAFIRKLISKGVGLVRRGAGKAAPKRKELIPGGIAGPKKSPAIEVEKVISKKSPTPAATADTTMVTKKKLSPLEIGMYGAAGGVAGGLGGVGLARAYRGITKSKRNATSD